MQGSTKYPMPEKKSEQFHLMQNAMERAHLKAPGAEYNCDIQCIQSLCAAFGWNTVDFPSHCEECGRVLGLCCKQ